jgi:RNA polymerase sigma-70 factor (ECF subfamily)
MDTSPSRASLDSLLAHADWVRALARTLVFDPTRADDVVQDAWLAALRRPPGRADNLRGWLAAVVRNAARQLGRSEEIRARHEHETAPPSTSASPEELVLAADLHRRLVEHVLELEEPYRSTVLLRFFHGLSPREIARRQACPVATVRTHLRRGCERLREKLRGVDGSCHGAWASLVLLANLRGGDLRAPSPLGLGGWIMSTAAKTSVAAAVIAACALLWWLHVREVEPVPPEPPVIAERSPLGAAGASEPREEALPSAREPIVSPRSTSPPRHAPDRAPTAPDPCAGDLRAFVKTTAPESIEVIVLGGLRPVHRGEAWLVKDARPEWDPNSGSPPAVNDAIATARPGSDGVFRFAAVAPGKYCVGVSVEDGITRMRSCRITEGAPTSRLVLVLGDAQIRGHVYFQNGLPAADVPVIVGRTDKRWNRSGELASTRTGLDGSYRLSGLCGGTCAIEDRMGGNEEDPGNKYFLIELAPDETKTIDFGSPRGLAVWSGRLLSPDGHPLPIVPSLMLQVRSTGVLQGVRREGDGTFHAELAPGEYAVMAQLWNRWREIGDLSMPGRDVQRDVALPPAWVAVKVLHGGRPADSPAGGCLVFLKTRGSDDGGTGQPGPDGYHHFFGVPPGEYEMSTSTNGIPRKLELDEIYPLSVRASDREIRTEIVVRSR